MQDNAPIHKAKFLIKFLRENEIETFDWSPQFPDLDSIENMFSEEICINLSNSMIKRLHEIIKNNGQVF